MIDITHHVRHVFDLLLTIVDDVTIQVGLVGDLDVHWLQLILSLLLLFDAAIDHELAGVAGLRLDDA